MVDAQPDEAHDEELFNVVRAWYGDRLSVEELDGVRERVGLIARAGRELRSVPLDNGDEPFVLFRPYRADGA